jgi:membrane protease YdiL (CAAX protease family)
MWAETPEQLLRSRRIRETAVLYALFVIPGIAAPASIGEIATGLGALIAVTIRNVSFALLILYILDVQNERDLLPLRQHPFPVATTLTVFLLLLLSSWTVAVVADFLGTGSDTSVARAFTAGSAAESGPTVVRVGAIIGAMVSVGVVEELFFRGYLIARLRQIGASPATAVATAALLFAAGHGYQGTAALVFSLVAGILLGMLWLRRPAIGAFAAGHAGYNLAAIALSAWYG